MVLIPRHPDIENIMLKHDELSGTAEAGAVVYLSGDKKVAKVSASGHIPYGLLGQKVKASAAGLPQNFEFPGEIGSSDARLGDPVLVYQGGLFETSFYNLPQGVQAGSPLFAKVEDANHNSKLVAVASGVALDLDGNPAVVAIAQSTLSASEAAAGKNLLIKLVK